MLRSLFVALLMTGPAMYALAKDSKPAEYQFKQAPLTIYDALRDLKAGEVPAIPADERKLLETVWQWRIEKKSAIDSRPAEAAVIESMLWASGIEDTAARDKYRQQFEKVVASAQAVVKGAKNDRERGERLMKVLHDGVMKEGYSLDQTSFATVFDEGKYNCVSSTAMYLLAGQRLGLKLTPISIPGQPFLPGHAALDLIDGPVRVQVEPTNPDGFDWGTKSKRPGVIIIGFVPDRKEGHETDALGIAASIYTNRGVAFGQEKEPQRLAAIRCNLSALALDPTDTTATNNLLSDFVNWGPALAKEKKFADAVRVLTFGREISPQSRELSGNLTSAYASYIDELLVAEKDQQALSLIEQAAKALPDDRDFQSSGEWYKRRSSDQQRDAGWEASLAVVDRGLKLVSVAEQKKLREWRISLFRQWSQELLEKKDIDGSAAVLARAFAIDPKDEAVHDGLGYHTAKALELLDEEQNGKMAEHFAALVKQFPKVKDVTEAGFSCAVRAIQALTEADKFADAVQAVERYRPLVSDAKKQAELGSLPYDLWARDLAEKKEWQKAYDKYVEGLKAFPKQPTLVQNLAATIVDWADPEIEAMKWDEAIRIYDQGLKALPEHSLLKQNREFCLAKKAGK